jgi:cellulose synthase (UDP-forming)
VFYDVMMPGKDRLNAAFWCGSSAIVRRTALEEVGGVETRTVTEDMHTSMQLHAAGWRTVYDSRELAIGIAPHDAGGFLVQRSRWAQGALQILRRDNPLTKRGLSLNQRLAYFAAVAYVFEYIPRGVYLLTPIACLLVGELPMRSVGWEALTLVFSFWALGVLTSRLLSQGRNPYLEAERYHLLKLTVMLQACVTYFWPRPLQFNVTPKAGDGSDHFGSSLSLILVQLTIGWLSTLAVGWAAFAYWAGAPWGLAGEPLLVTAGWALLNAGLVALLTRSILQHHHRRKVYRFAVETSGVIEAGELSGPARIVDLSAVGAGWESPVPIAPGQSATLRFSLGGEEIAAQVTVQSRRYDGAGFRYGAEFAAISDEDARRLILFLYQRHAPAIFERRRPTPATGEGPEALPLAS